MQFVTIGMISVVSLLLPLAPLHAQTQSAMRAQARAEFQLDHGAQNGPSLAASNATTSPSSTPEATSDQTQSVSDPGRTSSSSTSSVSPDKQWEYKCDEYGLDQCAPEIVKAGTTEVVLDLEQELSVSGPDAKETEVIWAPDSKRFACDYSPLHAHHTVFRSVAFYQMRGDKWVALHSPADEASERVQLGQLGKGHLPKDFNPPPLRAEP